MKTIRKILADAALLVLLGAVLGVSANQFRAKGHVRPTKNYFDKGQAADNRESISGDATSATIPTPAPSVASPKQELGHIEHPYQKISFDEVADLFADPTTAEGINLFVDARGVDAYDLGHIPGSLHCYPYESALCMERVAELAPQAEKIVVYCGGGQCEDSIFLCRELIDEFELPYSKCFLFEGGWKEWTANQMASEVGVPAP